MFVALKNWRERLRYQGDDADHRLLADAERTLATNVRGSPDLLRHFRATALTPDLPPAATRPLGPLGPMFANARPLSMAQNLSIMASVERGAAQQKRRG
jgi:hypothetical protein